MKFQINKIMKLFIQIHLDSFDEKYYENKNDYYNKMNEYNKNKREEGKFFEQLIQIKI